ncbi:MAG: hypothetical protein ABI643_00950 [Candidatus Doudnabacteria bacterium]
MKEKELGPKNIVSKAEFEKLSSDWTRLNKEYDGYIEQFLSDPNTKFTPDQFAQFKAMQQELFDLEVRLFKIAQGELHLEE